LNGDVDLPILGSEVLLRGDLPEAELIEHMNGFRGEIPFLPVSTADVVVESVWIRFALRL
jgi:hypothetical protein